jgi:hypothetical protein
MCVEEGQGRRLMKIQLCRRSYDLCRRDAKGGRCDARCHSSGTLLPNLRLVIRRLLAPTLDRASCLPPWPIPIVSETLAQISCTLLCTYSPFLISPFSKRA